MFFPIFIPMHSSGGGGNVPKWLLWIIAPILIGICLFTIALFLEMGNVVHFTRIWTAPKTCDYQLPENYRLVQNKKTKRYMVLDERKYGGYMYLFPSGKDVYFRTNPEDGTTFKDSCRAKGALKIHLESLAREAEKNSQWK